ncbi:MAG: oligosaccharide flippase family protein [Candidatus Thermoplasmatota archaeon]
MTSKDGVARKSLLPIINVAIGAVMGLLALKVMTLYFGIEAYGEFQYALAAVGLIYLFTDLNIGDAHTKRVSEGVHSGDCFATYTVLRIVSNAVFILATSTLLFIYTVVLGKPLISVTLTTIIAVVTYYVAKSMMSVASATFDAKLQTARSQLGGLVETVVRVTLVVGAAFVFQATIPYFGSIDANVPGAAWIRLHPAATIALAWTVGCFAASVVLFVYLLRNIERGRFRWGILRSYFAFSLPLFLPNSVGLIAFFVDRVVLGFFGANVDAGGFAAPRQIVGVIEGMAVAVGMILFPAISAAIASGNEHETRGLLDRATRYLSLVLMPGIAFLIFFPLPVLRLAASEEFASDAIVLSVLAVMIYIGVLARPHVTYLMGHDRAREAGVAGFVASVLVIVLNVILVPQDLKSLHVTLFGLGALGSAIATLVGTLAAYVLLARASRKVAPPTIRVQYWKHVLAGCVLGGVIWGTERLTGFELSRWYSIIFYAALGTVAYVLTLLTLREITREDVRYARETLSPSELFRYVRSELFADD